MSYHLYRWASQLLWFVASPWLRRRARGGGEWSERLGCSPSTTEGRVWIHAASVGEVAAATPLALGLSRAGQGVFLTVVTRTGRESAARLEREGVTVAYAPLDFVASVRRAIGRVRPRAVLLVETELWPNLLKELELARVSTAVVNGRLSPRSERRYSSWWSPVRRLVGGLSVVACQSEADRRRFVSIGIGDSEAVTTGNMKADVLDEPLTEDEKSALRDELGIDRERRVIVFGSVRPKEESTVTGVIGDIVRARGDAACILAPRHLDRVGAVASRLRSGGFRFRLRSEAPAEGGEAVMVLDTTGELPRIYALAEVAFVGGSLAPYGGHNPLEPAVHGVPVLIGPHNGSCRRSAERLVRAGGALVVSGGEGLRDAVLRLLSDESERRVMADAARAAVEADRGATARTIDLLSRRGVLGGASERSGR